jgi:hypothetical protein
MIEKQIVINELNKGKSIRKIARDYDIPNKTLHYWVKKWQLKSDYKKPIYNEYFFNKIDSPEKAYILGFILGDGHLTKKVLEITLALNDLEVLKYISNNIGGNIRIDKTFNREKKRFPRCRLTIGNKPILRNLNMLFGGFLKEDRHIPIIKKSLEKYLVLGFFDAEGCITLGKRKDREKMWFKIYFTSQLKMLEGIQNILLNRGISSAIHKRKHNKCYDMYIRKKETFKLGKWLINDDNIGLIRKQKAVKALLRLESDEFGRTA